MWVSEIPDRTNTMEDCGPDGCISQKKSTASGVNKKALVIDVCF